MNGNSAQKCRNIKDMSIWELSKVSENKSSDLAKFLFFSELRCARDLGES